MSSLWHWQIAQGLTYLTCSLLDPWKHGFFTRQFAPQTPESLAPLLDEQARVYRVKQVHGQRVLTPSEVESLGVERPEADGLLSENAHDSVWVCSADCVPVLIGDLGTGQVAALHAGWRGTAAEIVPEAIARFQALGTRLEDLRIALGPAISGGEYQVGLDVAQQVGKTLIQGESTPDWIEQLSGGKHPVLLPDSEPDRIRLDVRQVNLRQLQQLGVHAEQVAIAPYCTYQNQHRFFSYRRDRLKSVQWSGILTSMKN
ncbi:MAG: peptidoglycan editing factor PgeF [Roseofilum sp. SID2]|uniref:peptidoglycan editing factor PgeF n=1 Tax=unclassified Roseofilum TaxID=2620099 RepID=UPI001B025D50|nr:MULTISPECIES: peptidoglycan editing factor PgeF [unclassified Roseofilum]MBP0013831.1 peptidoglycan editing factor PgeF [Roseofilum sp. SID3]MBP0026002.1 peptidoglycan editing factor PgeF [Roseofilum sp. SID2]